MVPIECHPRNLLTSIWLHYVCVVVGLPELCAFAYLRILPPEIEGEHFHNIQVEGFGWDSLDATFKHMPQPSSSSWNRFQFLVMYRTPYFIKLLQLLCYVVYNGYVKTFVGGFALYIFCSLSYFQLKVDRTLLDYYYLSPTLLSIMHVVSNLWLLPQRVC